MPSACSWILLLLAWWQVEDQQDNIATALESGNPAEVVEAIQELQEQSGTIFRNYPALLGLLASEHAEVRSEVVKLVRKYGYGTHARNERLLEAIDSPDPIVRAIAYWPCWKSGMEATRFIERARIDLRSDSSRVVLDALEVVEEIGPEALPVSPELVRLLSSGGTAVRKSAMETLYSVWKDHSYGRSSVDLDSLINVEELERVADNLLLLAGDSHVASLVLYALAHLLKVQDVLHAGAYSKNSLFLTRLSSNWGPAELDEVVAALDDSDPRVRSFAMQLLGQFGEDARASYARVLEMALDTENTERGFAINALVKIDPVRKETLKAVLTTLDDTNAEYARTAAASVCAQSFLNDERVDAALLRLLNSQDPASSLDRAGDASEALRESALETLLQRGNTSSSVTAEIRKGLNPESWDRTSVRNASGLVRRMSQSSLPSPYAEALVHLVAHPNRSLSLDAMACFDKVDVPSRMAYRKALAAALRRDYGDMIAAATCVIATDDRPRIAPVLMNALERADQSTLRSTWWAQLRKDGEKRQHLLDWIIGDVYRVTPRRIEALRQLSALGSPRDRTVDVLIELITAPARSERPDPSNYVAFIVDKNRDWNESDASPACLGKIDSTSVFRRGLRTVGRSSRVRAHAAFALGRVVTSRPMERQAQVAERASRALLACIEGNENENTARMASIEALGMIRRCSELVVPALLDLVLDESEPIAIGSRSALALARFGDAAQRELERRASDTPGKPDGLAAVLIRELRRRLDARPEDRDSSER